MVLSQCHQQYCCDDESLLVIMPKTWDSQTMWEKQTTDGRKERGSSPGKENLTRQLWINSASTKCKANSPPSLVKYFAPTYKVH